jgi:beta-galactosidase/beta-glucuronidase
MKNTAIHNTSERLILLTILVLMFFSCKENSDNFRSTINLSGYWQFDLDSDNIGIEQKWFLKELSDSIKLPGTTDLNQKGFKNKDTTTLHLNRVNIYEGPAWYRKTINIAEGWQDHHIRLILERTKPSKIWIDDHYIGESFLLESPQHYDLSEFLTPGMHTITIRIDNNQKLTPFGNVHIYSDDTQTNWNGIIGDICLEASKQTYISDLQVYPDVDNKKAKVVLSINNQPGYDNINVELQITKELNDKIKKLKSINYTVPCDSMIEMEYTFGEKMDLWDEYHQPVYKLNAVISYKDQVIDNKTVTFGMRKFAAEGTQFAINGRITFLRGKHDACVFPLTGHPPMDAEGWIRVFSIAKSYGINHYRFHSWCPPEAAFEAADRLGIYLQPELPFWGGLEADSVAAMLETEGIALLKSYANHPSFVMFSPGNEIWSGHERIKKIIIELKRIDGRPLYTQGSNNNIGYLPPMEISDFHIAARTPYEHDTILTHTRLTQAFVDSKDGGILNLQMPSTMVNFDYAVSHIKVPLIGHEIGQYTLISMK